jgi:hypothetical protein
MGKFVKGQSGNPGGRPKIIASIRELAQGQTVRSIHVLVAIRDDERAPHAARIAAARELLDRAYGKPTQPIGGDCELEPVRFIIEGIERTRD